MHPRILITVHTRDRLDGYTHAYRISPKALSLLTLDFTKFPKFYAEDSENYEYSNLEFPSNPSVDFGNRF